MKKQILIIHSNMELGGAETSLLGLMQSINFRYYDVDLLLLDPTGSLFPLIPKEVNIIDTPKQYRHLMCPIKDVVLSGDFGIALARILGKIRAKRIKGSTYAIKQYAHLAAMPYLPPIEKKYDLAISFIDPHYIVRDKVNAKLKLGWIHFQFSEAKMNMKMDFDMWNGLDYIVQISESCKKQFDDIHPALKSKSIIIENILSKKFLVQQAMAFSVEQEMSSDSLNLLTIGRYSSQKNFDNLPFICKYIVDSGINLKWYIIGFGSQIVEKQIRDNIKAAGMERNVIILGKKDNPYPYIKSCDIYVQPSRWEGKSVAVREAQILNKPVVITNYPTAPSQLADGYDGVVVPMDNYECAQGILTLIQDKKKMDFLVENTKKNNYTNASELEKIYELIDEL